jgi:hypothetical protein
VDGSQWPRVKATGNRCCKRHKNERSESGATHSLGKRRQHVMRKAVETARSENPLSPGRFERVDDIDIASQIVRPDEIDGVLLKLAPGLSQNCYGESFFPQRASCR